MVTIKRDFFWTFNSLYVQSLQFCYVTYLQLHVQSILQNDYLDDSKSQADKWFMEEASYWNGALIVFYLLSMQPCIYTIDYYVFICSILMSSIEKTSWLVSQVCEP